jgi:hypothetical protein
VDERPSCTTDSDETLTVFCTKTCYLKWIGVQKKEAKAAKKETEGSEDKKQKVPWEDDDTLGILMEWITTEGNYSSFAGSTGNIKGKSQSQFHKEIALLVKSKKQDSQQDAK